MTRRCLAGARKSPLPASGPLFCVASERFCARRNAGGMRGKGRGEDSERKKLFQSIARCRRHRVCAELTSGRRVRLVDVRGAPGGPVRLDARGDLAGVHRLHGLPVRRSSCLRDPLAPHLPARCFWPLLCRARAFWQVRRGIRSAGSPCPMGFAAVWRWAWVPIACSPRCFCGFPTVAVWHRAFCWPVSASAPWRSACRLRR